MCTIVQPGSLARVFLAIASISAGRSFAWRHSRQRDPMGEGVVGDEDGATSLPLPIFKLTPGITSTSHGIACAQIAGEITALTVNNSTRAFVRNSCRYISSERHLLCPRVYIVDGEPQCVRYCSILFCTGTHTWARARWTIQRRTKYYYISSATHAACDESAFSATVNFDDEGRKSQAS